MKVAECACIEYKDDQIKIAFTVVDNDDNAILSGKYSFEMGVSVFGNNKFNPLKENIYDNEKVTKKDVSFPLTGSIEMSFYYKFKNYGNNNYMIYLYNEGYERAIKEFPITSLGECKGKYIPLPTFKGRQLDVERTVNVFSEKLKIAVLDWDIIDDDAVSIYLNGKLIEYNIVLKGKYTEIEIQPLNVGKNTLLLHAESTGSNGDCTVRIKVGEEALLDLKLSKKVSKTIIINRQ